MKICRDVAMITVGAVGALVLQKYKEPMLNKMEDVKDSAIDMATEKLEKMK